MNLFSHTDRTSPASAFKKQHIAMAAWALSISLWHSAVSAAMESESLLSAVSSPLPEYGLVMAPDGKSAVFARKSGTWGSRGTRSELYVTRLQSNAWTPPVLAFPGMADNDDPFFSVDGTKLFFTANRLVNDEPQPDSDIWIADYAEDAFHNPRPLERINSTATEYSPVQTADGTLYFASTRNGGLGAGDIWKSQPRNGAFQEPENLGAPVNTAGGEWNVFLPPRANYLIVEASGRPDAKSTNGDLYLHRLGANGWERPIALDHVNTTGSDLMPRLSPDGETVYFTSTKSLGSPDAEIYAEKTNDFLVSGTPAGQPRLLVVSRSNHEIVALDPITLDILARYPTGPGPHEVSASPDGKTVFAPNYGVYPKPHKDPILPSQMQFTSEPSDTLSRISLAGGVDHTRFSICSRSHGVATSPDSHVWVTCQNEGLVLELDGMSGALVKSWPAGDMGSHILVTTNDNRYVIASNVDAGSVSIFDRSDGSVKTVKTGKGAEGLALTPDQSHVWVGNTQENTISVVRVHDGTHIHKFSSQGRFPVKMKMAPDYSETWVVNTFSREIAILDAQTGAFKEKLAFDTPPLGILMSPDGERLYVSFPRVNEIRAFDRLTRNEVARTDGIMEGDGMAWVTTVH